MAQGLILEFDNIDVDVYNAVNDALGLDRDGNGDWPAGLLFHSGGAKPGGWVVFEVWDSQESQGRFMADRLGAALAGAGVTGPPARVEWLDLARYRTLG
jgi:hypothetical protein